MTMHPPTCLTQLVLPHSSGTSSLASVAYPFLPSLFLCRNSAGPLTSEWAYAPYINPPHRVVSQPTFRLDCHHVRLPLRLSLPFADSPLRVLTLPAHSQLNIDLDAEEDIETSAMEFEPAKDMRVRITSTNVDAEHLVAKVGAVLDKVVSAVGHLVLRRLFLYTDSDVVISREVCVVLCDPLVCHSQLLTARR